ncbi:MAG TPA: tetratricopeptide repeat protein [Longimicrobiaceae bacterium]|nr:tetratricopeptide repeat protein [Longimicrobiaceae bacterium]
MALLLWQTCRSVHLWGQAGPRLRLFAPDAAELRRGRLEAAGVDDELRAPLALLAGLLENRRVVDVPRVVEACREVARWAEGRGKLATALAFAQAAAVAEPEDASLAVAVGRFARMRAEYERAESWFEHAIVLARLTRDRQAYAEAYAGLGNLYVQKGGFPKARLYHQRCLRAARRYSLHEMEGAALHNLYGVEVECGNAVQADEYAEAALDVYPRSSPGLLRLAHDVAYVWINQGHYRRALPVVREVLLHLTRPADRIVVLGDVARAGGGAGETDSFERAWAEAWLLADSDCAEEGSARALTGLAYGAVSLGEWKRAERAATKAAHIAEVRGESKVLLAAEAIIGLVRDEITGEAQSDTTTPLSERLAGRFVETLRRSRAVAGTA